MRPDAQRASAQDGSGGAGGHQRRRAGAGPAEGGRAGRSIAEWTTLLVGLALILGLAALVTYLYLTGADRPPVIEAIPLTEEVRHDGGLYYLPVRVTNRGDLTAADVRIQAERSTSGGTSETAELGIEFLAGGESAEGTVVFSADPLAGDLTIAVTSFRRP